MAPSIDRISGLSDDVICHILSFLPTTSASTNILARRWRFLWIHVQNLYFEGSDFDYEVQRGVRNLCVYFKDETIDYTDEFTLPRCLFTCKSLVEATIRCGRGIPSSVNVLLPSLKKLNLSHFRFEDTGSLPRLLSGCPVLEDLIIDWCDKERTYYHLDLAFISSPTIKNLDVDVEYGCRKLKINAPSVEYLNLRVSSLEDITEFDDYEFLN